MADREKAAGLDRTNPNPIFEELIAQKNANPKKPEIQTREDAIRDILKTAPRINEKVNKMLGLEGETK